LLQSCIARVIRHARFGIVTICTSSFAKAAPIYREIFSAPSKIASASPLTSDHRRQLAIAWAFRQYELVKRLFPSLLGAQLTLPLTQMAPFSVSKLTHTSPSSLQVQGYFQLRFLGG